MKIAMLGQKGVPATFGGIERHVEELGTRLVTLGHEVLVYCRPWYLTKVSGGIVAPGITVVCTPSINSKHFDAISHTFISTLDAMRRNVDVYHFHGVGPSLLAWIPRILRPHARVIVTFHCIDRKHGKWGRVARIALRTGEWAACRFAHETITVSRTLTEYCQAVFNVKTNYIPNGITGRGTITSNLIREFGLESNRYVAMVSRLVRHKGAHHLIRAWIALREQSPVVMRGLKLAIVGDSAFTDDYVAEVRALAANDPSIIFTGYRAGTMLDELFSNALLVAHPSESEGLPIAVLEAMSYGKVVLGSDIPENLEVIATHGVPFANTNVDDLVVKLRNLLMNQHLLPTQGAAAREFVLANYHWDDIARQVDALYRKTVAHPIKETAVANT